MRILGLDLGSKTIGVAISDPLGFTAQGLTTIKRKNKTDELSQINNFCIDYQVELIVLGLPKNMNGSIGEAGERSVKYAKTIEENLKIKVKLWDERLTTVAATRAMLEGDLSREKRKKIVDKLAAMFILQGYLDSIR